VKHTLSPLVRNCLCLAALVVSSSWASAQSSGSEQQSKPQHVITNEDIESNSAASEQSSSATSAPKSDSDAANKSSDGAAAGSSDAGATMSDEEMRAHHAGGVDPNEKPKDAIKRIEREENELRSKLDMLRARAETEPSENKRRMYLEAVDHQQVTLQQMAEDRAKLQKSEDEKDAAAAESEQGEGQQDDGSNPAPAQPPADTAK
jgi:hypothetical protein